MRSDAPSAPRFGSFVPWAPFANSSATLLEGLVVVAAGLALGRGPAVMRGAAAAAAVVMAAACLLTASRGAWMAVAVGLAALVAYRYHRALAGGDRRRGRCGSPGRRRRHGERRHPVVDPVGRRGRASRSARRLRTGSGAAARHAVHRPGRRRPVRRRGLQIRAAHPGAVHHLRAQPDAAALAGLRPVRAGGVVWARRGQRRGRGRRGAGRAGPPLSRDLGRAAGDPRPRAERRPPVRRPVDLGAVLRAHRRARRVRRAAGVPPAPGAGVVPARGGRRRGAGGWQRAAASRRRPGRSTAARSSRPAAIDWPATAPAAGASSAPAPPPTSNARWSVPATTVRRSGGSGCWRSARSVMPTRRGCWPAPGRSSPATRRLARPTAWPRSGSATCRWRPASWHRSRGSATNWSRGAGSGTNGANCPWRSPPPARRWRLHPTSPRLPPGWSGSRARPAPPSRPPFADRSPAAGAARH